MSENCWHYKLKYVGVLTSFEGSDERLYQCKNSECKKFFTEKYVIRNKLKLGLKPGLKKSTEELEKNSSSSSVQSKTTVRKMLKEESRSSFAQCPYCGEFAEDCNCR